MELPRFVSKEHIFGKEVFDSELLNIGTAEDLTGIEVFLVYAETIVKILGCLRIIDLEELFESLKTRQRVNARKEIVLTIQ